MPRVNVYLSEEVFEIWSQIPRGMRSRIVSNTLKGVGHEKNQKTLKKIFKMAVSDTAKTQRR